MADDRTRDELAQLRAELTADFEARLAAQAAELRAERRPRQRRRVPRRFLPLALVALLVVLTPLATFAASPFNDLTGGVHDANIGLIYDAGITKGCVPNVSYCPTGNVTREEMASFLARTAGLGDNAPVVNAKTAQTATNATHAGSADTATNAQNAAALGGQPAGAFLPAAGDTTIRYSPLSAVPVLGGGNSTPGTTVVPGNQGNAVINIPAGGLAQVLMPLPRTTGEHGRALAVKSLRVCYTAAAGIYVGSTTLNASERGTDEQILINDPTDRGPLVPTCYDSAPASPQAVAGQTYLYLGIVNTPGSARTVLLHSVALTLTPLAAGAAELPPVANPNASPQP